MLEDLEALTHVVDIRGEMTAVHDSCSNPPVVRFHVMNFFTRGVGGKAE